MPWDGKSCGAQITNNWMVWNTFNKKRYNLVLERIKNAASGRWKIICEDQVIGGANCRLDSVLQKNRGTLIINITCPFKNKLQALVEERKINEEKYIELLSLGSWYRRNNRVMRRLCSEKYTIMRRIIAERHHFLFSGCVSWAHNYRSPFTQKCSCIIPPICLFICIILHHFSWCSM